VALVLAGLCFLPALGVGFFADDFIVLFAMDGTAPCMCGPENFYLYSNGRPEEVTARVQDGTFPWWTGPDFKVALWRPLSSALLRLDHALFGRWAPGYHAHSLLWFLALVAIAGRLYRRHLSAGLAAMAVLVFAVDESHWMSTTWVSNRHIIVSAVFAFLGLLAHLRWREQGWRPGLPLSLGCYLLSLAGGESGLQVFAFVLAYELVGARDSVRQRLAGALPALGLGVAYLVAYKLSDFGARGSGHFIDPIAETARFLVRAQKLLPAMIAELLAGTEVFYATIPGLYRALLPLSLGIISCFGVLLWRALKALPADEARTVRWWVLGGLLALPPPIGSLIFLTATSRSLLFPSLASAVAVAAVLHYGARLLRRQVAEPTWLRGAVALPLALLALMNTVVEPLATPFAVTMLKREAEAGGKQFRELELEETPGTEVVVLTATGTFTGYGSLLRAFYREQPLRPWWNVSWMPQDQELRRTGPASFELRALKGSLLLHPAERFYQAHARELVAGQRFSSRLMRVTVLEIGEAGPSRLEVTLDRSLDDPSLRFLAWKDGALQPVGMPRTGETLLLKGSASSGP
jgi:hypothetical protein